MGWSGYRCEIAAAPVDSSASSGSKSHSSDHLDLKKKKKKTPLAASFPNVCYFSCRYDLHCCPRASVAAAGDAGGRRHLMV